MFAQNFSWKSWVSKQIMSQKVATIIFYPKKYRETRPYIVRLSNKASG